MFTSMARNGSRVSRLVGKPLFSNGYSAKVKSGKPVHKSGGKQLRSYIRQICRSISKFAGILQQTKRAWNTTLQRLENAESTLDHRAEGYTGGEIGYSEYLFSLKTANERERYPRCAASNQFKCRKIAVPDRKN